MNSKMIEELKPCPFCGSPDAKPDCNGEGDYDVTCMDCHAGSIGVGPEKESRESAIVAWNTRTDPDKRLREALEAIREVVSKRQLPITNQVYELADAALSHNGG